MGRMMRGNAGRWAKVALMVALAGAVSRPVSGQAVRQADRNETAGATYGGAVVGAVAGGALGFLVGAKLGSLDDCYEICWGVVFGALGGEALGVAIGAHVGNRGRGHFVADLATSVLVGTLGIVIASNSSHDDALLLGAVGQVAATVMVEISTSPNYSASVGPRLIEGRPGVGATLRF